MRLSLGPVLFYWSRQQLLEFYAEMAEQPLDVIYLGETVCSKRRALSLDDWLGLARDLREHSGVEVVLSGLALIEAGSERASLRRLCANGEVRVEANDMGAVQMLSEQGVPFVGGPALNVYNAFTLAELQAAGMQRWVPPVECSAALLRALLEQCRQQEISLPELEVFAWGYLPLAYSARCFTARAEQRPKDNCDFVCQYYPEGLPLLSQEGQPLFTINGIQTLSAGVCNLLAEYPQLQQMGVDMLRLSPRMQSMAHVISYFDQVRQGGEPPLVVDGCNGYWYGQAGMLRVEEAGLC
ncbi:MAG: U32 family peptidase [Gammaproteobacteria bacterium]|nr:U32 family peptidase [Gammaproteobacteria bacterium]